MLPDRELLNTLAASLGEATRERLERAATAIVRARQAGKRVVVVVGSGPNLHEGVTMLIAGLIRQGVVDGVVTSSALTADEMGGALERVCRVALADVPGVGLGAPFDATLDASIMPPDHLAELRAEMPFDEAYCRRLQQAPARDIVRAAANLAYPLGLRTEHLAREARNLAATNGLSPGRVRLTFARVGFARWTGTLRDGPRNPCEGQRIARR